MHARPPTLCERCGYRIEDLPDHGTCPECGLVIADSLPEKKRPGSAWQRGRSVGSWAATGWAVVTRPGRTFGAVRVEGRWPALVWVNIFLAGWPSAGAVLAVQLARGGSLGALTPASAALVVVWAALPVLTWIETMGLRYFGRQRRWRISAEVAWAVCAHASYAWVLAGVLVAAGYVVGALDLEAPVARWLDGQAWRWLGHGQVVSLRPLRGLLGLSAGAFVGVLAFESLVYIGVRRCRFANVPRG